MRGLKSSAGLAPVWVAVALQVEFDVELIRCDMEVALAGDQHWHFHGPSNGSNEMKKVTASRAVLLITGSASAQAGTSAKDAAKKTVKSV